VVVERTSPISGRLDVFDRVLDKGIVIDAWMRVQLIGLDLLTIEALVVVASLPRYQESSESLGLAGLPPLRGARRRRHAVTSANRIDGISPKAHKNGRTPPPQRYGDDAYDFPRPRSERESTARSTETHPTGEDFATLRAGKEARHG